MSSTIKLAARESPLSRAQAVEVINEIKLHHPKLYFECHFIKTYGDSDRTTSLRSLDKTDFFTREVDALIINGECRIAIHSAKDLPEPLPIEIAMIALTKGVDSSDSLVIRQRENLKEGSVVATSSVRREEAVKGLFKGIKFVDIRGTIGERLNQLDEGVVDGVVIAEAALIRLGLTHLYRIKLPGPTVPFQGQLAIMARKDDIEMNELFKCVDSRRN